LLLFPLWAYAQTTQKPNPAPPPTKSQTLAKADQPTLGFNHIKDVSPVADTDAYLEEQRLQKELPGNQFTKDKRALHEAVLVHDFLEGVRDSKECRGITFYMNTDKVPDFAVQITVDFHDTPKHEQEWVWMLSNTRRKELGGLGTQSSAKLTARDVCLTVWEDVDPNHFKKPGGKIE